MKKILRRTVSVLCALALSASCLSAAMFVSANNTNLALSATVTVSSDPEEASNINDNDPGSYWTAVGAEQTVDLTWAEPVQIAYLTLSWGWDKTSENGYTVQVKYPDGSDWEDIRVTRNNRTQGPGTFYFNDYITFDAGEIEVVGIRIGSIDDKSSFRELEAYAAEQNAYRNLLFGANAEGSKTGADFSAAVDGDYATGVNYEYKPSADNTVKFKVTLDNAQPMNTIYIWTDGAVANLSKEERDNFKLEYVTEEGVSVAYTFDDDDMRINTTDYNSLYVIDWNAAVSIKSLEFTISENMWAGDDDCSLNTTLLEIEAYNKPVKTAQEVQFRVNTTRTAPDNALKNVSDVVIMTHISEEEAAQYSAIKFDIVTYCSSATTNSGKKNGVDKTKFAITDSNVYESVILGDAEYTYEDFEEADGYVAAVKLTGIVVEPLVERTGFGRVYVRVSGVDENGAETALTGMYMIDVPFIA